MKILAWFWEQNDISNNTAVLHFLMKYCVGNVLRNVATYYESNLMVCDIIFFVSTYLFFEVDYLAVGILHLTCHSILIRIILVMFYTLEDSISIGLWDFYIYPNVTLIFNTCVSNLQQISSKICFSFQRTKKYSYKSNYRPSCSYVEFVLLAQLYQYWTS